MGVKAMYINSYGQLVVDDYLAHYGILGQKWGIRRYQPYPGDYHGDGKFVGKDDAWRQSKAAESEGRYDRKIEKVGNKIRKTMISADKAYAKGASDKVLARKDRKLSELNDKAVLLKAKKQLENHAIMNMNSEDIRGEKIEVGKSLALDALVTVGTMALAATGKSPVIMIRSTDLASLQTNYRLNKQAEKEKYGNSTGTTSEAIKAVAKRAQGMADSGMTNAQIARKLGVPESTIGNMVERNDSGSNAVSSKSDLEKMSRVDFDGDRYSPSSLNANKTQTRQENASSRVDRGQPDNQSLNQLTNTLASLTDKKYAKEFNKAASKLAKADVELARAEGIYEARKNSAVEMTRRNAAIALERAKEQHRKAQEEFDTVDSKYRDSMKAVQRAKQMHSSGMTYAEIAKKLGVSESSVSLYLNN